MKEQVVFFLALLILGLGSGDLDLDQVDFDPNVFVSEEESSEAAVTVTNQSALSCGPHSLVIADELMRRGGQTGGIDEFFRAVSDRFLAAGLSPIPVQDVAQEVHRLRRDPRKRPKTRYIVTQAHRAIVGDLIDRLNLKGEPLIHACTEVIRNSRLDPLSQRNIRHLAFEYKRGKKSVGLMQNVPEAAVGEPKDNVKDILSRAFDRRELWTSPMRAAPTIPGGKKYSVEHEALVEDLLVSFRDETSIDRKVDLLRTLEIALDLPEMKKGTFLMRALAISKKSGETESKRRRPPRVGHEADKILTALWEENPNISISNLHQAFASRYTLEHNELLPSKETVCQWLKYRRSFVRLINRSVGGGDLEECHIGNGENLLGDLAIDQDEASPQKKRNRIATQAEDEDEDSAQKRIGQDEESPRRRSSVSAPNLDILAEACCLRVLEEETRSQKPFAQSHDDAH